MIQAEARLFIWFIVFLHTKVAWWFHDADEGRQTETEQAKTGHKPQKETFPKAVSVKREIERKEKKRKKIGKNGARSRWGNDC
jgi:hypothetical protein